MALGAAALASYWLDVRALRGGPSTWPTMKPATALLALLCGAAVVLAGRGASRQARTLRMVAAVAAAALALASVLGHVLGFSVGVDVLLMSRPIGSPIARTAAAFLLIAISALTLDRVTPRGHSVSQVLALAAGSIASVALLGYLFDIPSLHSAASHASEGGMALPTALSIAFAASGLLVARPDVGFVAAVASPHAGGVVARRLLLGLLAFAPVALFVVMGRRFRWYSDAELAAILVFLAFAEGAALILITAARLNAHDVRQKEAESLTRASEQRFRRLIALAPDAIFTADLEGRYTGVNDAGCRMLRLPSEVILSRSVPDFLPPEDGPRLARFKEELMGGAASVGEWTLRRGDGTEFPAEVSAAILRDGSWLGFVRDISDRKRGEAARAAIAHETARLYADEARQRAWLRSLVDQMPEGVVILDAVGRIVMTNRAMSSFVSERIDDAEVAVFDLLLPNGEGIPPGERPAARALERGESSLGLELALRDAHGALIPVLASAAPIRADDGAITGATVLVQDMTRLKELERLREEWASVVAHDLRQPVSAISLSVESLQGLSDLGVPERSLRAIGRIRSAATRLGRMVDDLFDASRIEAHRLSVTPRVVDVGTLLAMLAEGLRGATGDHEIVVDAPAGQLAFIDPDRIQQVLTNLVSNAVKYGAPGSEIRIEAREEAGRVELSVMNWGAGIPPEEIPTLFSRFARTRRAREARTPGTGLGLYIAKGLVEAHGGRIWVDSTPGQSTTFHITVAAPPAGAPARVEPAAPQP
jgi:PAS domain S-box-containing protein